MKPTWTRRRPNATSASITRSAAASEVTIGFSQKTGLPAAMQARSCSSWAGPQEQITTACTRSERDQRLRRVEDLGALGSRGRGAVPVDVADRDDLDPGEHLGETADVILTDHPRPDDADPEAHFAPQYLST